MATQSFYKLNLQSLISFVFAILYSLSFTSCINNLQDEIPEPGDIPISVYTSVKESKTRITEDKFDDEETIGLYITIQPSSIERPRYIDNMRFTYNAEEGFSPDETIFYPEGDNSCDFISYYPYRKNAINKGETGIEVEVQTDQSTHEAISTSDFMIATTKGVKASEKPVKLNFDHKLFKLNIQLKVESGYTLQSLIDANPEVRIKNVYTKATYDFNTNQFTNLNTKADIIPHGTWTIQDEMLCGKSAIIIPQTLSQSHIFIELYVADRLFECAIEQEYIMTSGDAEDNTITLLSSSDAVQSSIIESINGWNERENEMVAKEKNSYLQVSQLDFSKSYVLKVLNMEKQVAEICLEYLRTDDMEAQAIVAYPMKDEKADLTKGLVLELIDESENKHKGHVSWDVNTNKLTYAEGSASVPTYIYIAPDGEIKTTRPADALQLQLKPDLLVDTRGSETIEYPITKIATQYWIKSNLKTTKYKDGTDINKGGETVNAKAPQYYDRSNAYYFYNSTAIASGKLSLPNWRIGSETDFSLLRAYVNNNAKVLKNGIAWDDSSITNLTGFNGIATGYFTPTYMYNKRYAAYWCVNNDNPQIAEKMVTLYVDDNKITISDAASDVALAIKYIRY